MMEVPVHVLFFPTMITKLQVVSDAQQTVFNVQALGVVYASLDSMRQMMEPVLSV